MTYFRKWVVTFVFLLPLLALSAILAGQNFTVSTGTIRGQVTDAYTGKPLTGALLRSRAADVRTDGQGQYSLKGLTSGSRVLVSADGYATITATVDNRYLAQGFLFLSSPSPLNLQLRPNVLQGTVLDEQTNQPIAGAEVETDGRRTVSDAAGRYQLRDLIADPELRVKASGYRPRALKPGATTQVNIGLEAAYWQGTIVDQSSGRPVAGAGVSVGGASATTDEQGRYRLPQREANGQLRVKASGYRPVEAAANPEGATEVKLTPFSARGVYLAYPNQKDPARLKYINDLVDAHNVNTVVIDVKGDFGDIAYPSRVPLVKEVGAENITFPDLEDFVRQLKAKGVYVIARQVLFKDNALAEARPEWAIGDKRTSKPFVQEGSKFLDPFRKEVWDYNLAIAKEVASKGFDEIQFDYIRFPNDIRQAPYLQFAQAPTDENRPAAINGFLARMQEELRPTGVATAIDIFGLTIMVKDDGGIGQRLEDMARYVDYVSLMLYPSTFAPGNLDLDKPPAQPYETVRESLETAAKRLGDGQRSKLKPWLQDFDDYVFDLPYGAREVAAQIQATADSKAAGFILWNAGTIFTKDALGPKP